MAAAIRGNQVAERAERDITATGDELEAVAAAGRVVGAAIEVEPLDGQELRLANEPNGGGHPVPVGRFQAQAVTVEVDASVANVPQADFQGSADLDRWGRAVESNTTAIVAGGLKERLQFLLIGRPREAASLNGDAATCARAGSRLGARLCGASLLWANAADEPASSASADAPPTKSRLLVLTAFSLAMEFLDLEAWKVSREGGTAVS